MATTVKRSLNRSTRELNTSKNVENSNPNCSLLTPRRISTPVFTSSDRNSGRVSKSLASASVSRSKGSLVKKKKKKLPSKDLNSSDLKDVSKIASLAPDPAHLMRFARKDQRVRIRAPLSSPMDPVPSERRQNPHMIINLDEISSRKQDARNEVDIADGAPDLGDGRVMYLAKAFEKLFTEKEDAEEHRGAGGHFARVLFESGKAQRAEETESSYSVRSTSSERRGGTDERCGVNSGEQSSVGSNLKRDSNMNDCGNRIKRNSTGSSGRSWTKKPKITDPLPFMLKTEERGRMKEEHFAEKMKEMLQEEERLRVPVAQRLPWTTDEPEYPFKPPIKELTEPIDLVLNTDLRAVNRAEFDHQVAEKMNFIEKIKSERERQRKMEEEEEIKKLRRKLVPKASPMPCFDQPFVPKRSMLPYTIPKEPKFHSKQRQDKS